MVFYSHIFDLIAKLIQIALIVAALIGSWFVLYLPLLSPIASLLYARFTLKTRVSWDLAEQLAPLLRPNMWTMEWLPMLAIKVLPEEKRVEAL